MVVSLKQVDIVIPVYNNSSILEWSIKTQIAYFRKHLKNVKWQIIIADNASTDNTKQLAKRLIKKYPNVKYFYTSVQGRGGALRYVWANSKADFVSYMDVDLATRLDAFPRLIDELLAGNDIVVGSKYIVGSSHQRAFIRLIMSKTFNFLCGMFLGAKFTDAQLGFKSLTRKAAERLLPLIEDDFWFFDTELLYYAEKMNMKVKEIPVVWHEGKKSGVKLFQTAFLFAEKLLKLKVREEK